jgi:hypothetical protein
MNETSDNNPQYPNPNQDPEDVESRMKNWGIRILFYARSHYGSGKSADARREASASSTRDWNDPTLTA